MLYSSQVLTLQPKAVVLTIFIQFLTVRNHKAGLFPWVYFFLRFWSIIDPVTLCVPPVHNRVIYCYALQNDHQDKSSYHPVSYKAINLLHITLTHIINFILLIYSFCNWKFVFINLPYYLYSLSTHFHSGNHLLVHCIYGFVSVFVGFFICFLDSRYKWNQGVFVFLCMTYFT